MLDADRESGHFASGLKACLHIELEMFMGTSRMSHLL